MNVGISSVARRRQSIRVPRSCVVQTPDFLADAMIAALGWKDTDAWLEPCVGNGALLSALSRRGIKRDKIFGLDVDARSQPNDRFGRISRGTEFLEWSRSTRSRFDRIVANPPYVAIERLHPAIQMAAIHASLSDEVKVSANGNAWYAFLCAAIRLLRKNGSLCFLLPAAWDYANYAAPLRASISRYFIDVEIYRTTTPIFRAENVQEGAVVLLGRGRRDLTCNTVRDGSFYRCEVPSIDELIIALSSKDGGARRQKRRSQPIAAPAARISPDRQMLGDILSVRLGVVTGDSSYFVLNEKRRRELRLPLTAVVPILSRAKHLISPNMTAVEWEKLKDRGERVWLFNPDVRASANKFVRSYLRFGRDGGCEIDNHKVTIRKPWFRFPARPESDGFMSGMSTWMPWLSFRGMPGLAATNTLYLVNFIDHRVRRSQRIGVAMSLLTSSVRDQMRGKGRAYAAGLLKFEPSDLLALKVPKLGSVVAGMEDYREALRALGEGDDKACMAIADGCLR